MKEIELLDKKVKELEKRIEKLESAIFSAAGPDDKLMDTFYEKAKTLAAVHKNITPIFLQKKLWIDYIRASEIIKRLEQEGIVKRA